METTSDEVISYKEVSTNDSYTVIAFLGSKLPNQYKNMIFSKWLRSQKYGNDYFRLINADSYYAAYHKYIESVLARPNVVIRLAVLSDDHDVCLGFSVSELSILFYVHVQRDQRKQGIAKSLVPVNEIDTITSLTNTGMTLWASKLPKAVFNPFI